MQLSGTQKIAAPVQTVWECLNDRDVLARCTPGCKELVQVDEDHYEATLELGIAAIRGKYKGRLAIEDKVPPSHYRLRIEGQGGPGFVTASLNLDLEPHGDETLLKYQGEAQVGGPVASIGQRVLGGVAKMIMGQFFGALAREIEQRKAG
ncbi:MAG TPA: carbon monoxide dehydrogenase subunit G [Thermaerobacter sp.]